jgi:trimethylamine---corrinoid protein Co-methyltransferase
MPAARSTASASGSRGACAGNSSPGTPRPSSSSTPATPSAACASAGRTRCSCPPTARPSCADLDEGRRYATLEDFRNFVKLAYLAPLHHSGGTVCEPVDLPVNKRHLDMVYSHIRYSDKPFMGSVTAPDRAEDTVELARILFGAEFVDQNTVIASLINANSPHGLGRDHARRPQGLRSHNQATVISPFILAGPCPR